MDIIDYISYKMQDNRYVLIPVENHVERNSFLFNSTAFDVIELLRTGDKQKAVEGIMKKYEMTDDAQISKDVDSVIAKLDQIGFLRNSEKGKSTQANTLTSKKIYEKMYSERTAQKKPFKVFLEITNECTLMCKHCYKGKQLNRYDINTMGRADYFRILEELKELGAFEINITGGEATENKNCLDILRYAIKLGFCVVLLTNGQNIDDAYARELASLSLYDVRFSFYGTETLHDEFVGVPGSFQRTLSALRCIHKYMGIGTAVFVATKLNFKSFDEFKKPLDIEGITVHANTVIFPTLDANQSPISYRLSYDDAKDFYRKHITDFSGSVCSAGISRFRITPDGNVYPCEMMESILLGNVLRQNFSDILHSETYENWCKEFESIQANLSCTACEKRKHCNLCIGLFLMENGTFYKKSEHLCEVAGIKQELSRAI